MAQTLADLQGSERATLGPSTLHLFWDLFGMLAAEGVSICMDSGVYPILRWAVERAAARGARVRSFQHHDVASLWKLLNQPGPRRARRVIVTDGFCPSCGKVAPIARYLELARAHGGLMVIDDTQALGIFGHAPDSEAPYGKGGGGITRYFNTTRADVLVISSLSKAFGVPIASLSGSSNLVRWFESASDTRVHCSPPSIAAVHAAQNALALNRHHGDALRLRLARLVCRFRERLKEAGLATTGGLFPVQTLANVSGSDATSVHERLMRAGIRSVLRRGDNGGGPQLSLIITALHNSNEIDRLADVIAYAGRRNGPSKDFRRENHEIQ